MRARAASGFSLLASEVSARTYNSDSAGRKGGGRGPFRGGGSESAVGDLGPEKLVGRVADGKLRLLVQPGRDPVLQLPEQRSDHLRLGQPLGGLSEPVEILLGVELEVSVASCRSAIRNPTPASSTLAPVSSSSVMSGYVDRNDWTVNSSLRIECRTSVRGSHQAL